MKNSVPVGYSPWSVFNNAGKATESKNASLKILIQAYCIDVVILSLFLKLRFTNISRFRYQRISNFQSKPAYTYLRFCELKISDNRFENILYICFSHCSIPKSKLEIINYCNFQILIELLVYFYLIPIFSQLFTHFLSIIAQQSERYNLKKITLIAKFTFTIACLTISSN